MEQQKLHDAEKLPPKQSNLENQIIAKKKAIINKEQEIEDIKADNADALTDATDHMAQAMDDMRILKSFLPRFRDSRRCS